MIDPTVLKQEMGRVSPVVTRGRIVEINGPVAKAILSGAAVGDLVSIQTRVASATGGSTPLLAQVVSFTNEISVLSPFGSTADILPGSEVEIFSRQPEVRCGAHLLGAVVDGLGNVIKPTPTTTPASIADLYPNQRRPLHTAPPPPLSRTAVSQVFSTGIRSIDAFVTLGRGQRMSVFAEPGVGKTTLMGMIAGSAQADINVIAMIGERGREVREMISETIPEEVRLRTVFVVSTSDEAAVCRVNAAQTATAIAEYFRDCGKHVLLQMDSLTRLFRAYREVGLASGEVPVRNGYPPSVFARIPELLERAGTNNSGQITALYTILLSSEFDEDPMVEEVKGLTDGHLLLSNELAQAGHYPAVDVSRSLSRLSNKLLSPESLQAQKQLRAIIARINEEKDLLALGGKPSPELESALSVEPALNSFLRQEQGEYTSFEETLIQLKNVLEARLHSADDEAA